MEDIVRKLIKKICQEGQFCGQVRMTKLIYLIEWEYFAWTRERLTDLDWIFWHYGPWSKKLSSILDEFDEPVEEEIDNLGLQRVFWKPSEFYPEEIKLPADLKGIIARVLETFGNKTTEAIIRYTYFNTEPMQFAERGNPLDFGITRKPLKPYSPVSGLKKDIRESIKSRLATAVKETLEKKEVIEGEISSQDFNNLHQIDIQGCFDLPEGKLFINSEIRQGIAREG